MPQDSSESRESRRILDRVGKDTEGFLRIREPQQDAAGDWAEIWGRRIGRSLGAAFVVVLIVWLIRFLARTG